MNTNDENRLEQNVDRAVRALKTPPVPAGPPPDLLAAVLAAGKADTQPKTRSLKERIASMNRFLKIAAAAAVVGVVAGYFLLVHPTASVTFAQVIENVTKAESISFVFRQKLGSQPVLVSRMWMQRDKVRMDLVGVEMSAELTGPQAEGVRKLQQLGEGGNLPVLLTMIGDTSRKEAIELDHFRKTAVQKKMDARAAADIPQNLVEKFRNIKGDDAELVGEEQRNGRKVLVYRLTKLDLPIFMARKEPGDQIEMTVWVDAKTGLPVRIRIEGALSATRDDHSFFDWDEFAWNQSLDPGLFSLEIPEGYAVKEPPPAARGAPAADAARAEEAKARNAAQTVQSMQNVKTLGRDAHWFASNHENKFPIEANWPEALREAPGFAESNLTDPASPASGRAYAINAKVAGHQLSAIHRPDRAVLFFECAFGSPPGGGPELLPPQPRRPGGYVTGFCDGHVERILRVRPASNMPPAL